MKILLLLIISFSLWADIGSIMAIRGSADIKRSDGSLSVKSGMTLLSNDEIITHKKSRVQVMLKDDTVVTIGENSSFVFEEFEFDGSKNSKLSMRANYGFFRSVTGMIGRVAPDRFKLKTQTATIGIRGTDFSGEIEEGREIFWCYRGAIFVEFAGNINDLESGMMMEIFQNKFEIKKFDIGKVAKNIDEITAKKMITKLEDKIKTVIIKSINTIDISSDMLSNVIQVSQDILNDNPQKELNNYRDMLFPEEAFDISVQSEDREIEY